MLPGSTDDHQSLDSTSYGYDVSTSTRGSDSRRFSNASQAIKNRWGQGNNTDLLLKLYSQRNAWRKYGNLRVLCYESFILAPVKLWWWMAEIFVLSTMIIYAYEFFYMNWLILVPAVIIATLEWMAFYKTCMRDPGVMPRPKFADAMKNLISVLATWNGGPGPGTKRIVARANGQQEELHYCWRCHHFRSGQTSHCGTCDCCMILHDHHCPVFGGCVAKNNISSFHTMIISMGVFWLYMIGFCVYKISSYTEDGYNTNKSEQEQNPHLESAAGTPVTFYVIMSEIIAVLIVPFFVACIKETFCKPCFMTTQQTPILTLSKDVANTILQFAQRNNFTIQEVMQLKEILQMQDSVVEIGSQDLNHNSFFTGPPVSTI